MKKILTQVAQWPLLLFLLLGTTACLYFFQEAQVAMSQLAGEKVVLIDLRKGYDLAEIQGFFEQIGEEGRSIHQQATGVTDMIFPLFYGLFLILLAAFLIKKISSTASTALYGALFPLVLVVVDYGENVQILHLLYSYPQLTASMVDQAAQWTFIKNVGTTLCLLEIAVLLLLLVIKKLKTTPS